MKAHRLEVANIKFKPLTGQDVNFRTFQSEVDQLYLSVPRLKLVNIFLDGLL